MVFTTANAAFTGMFITEKGPDGKRYWNITYTAGAFNDTDISVGRVNGIGAGAITPVREYVRPGGRCVVTNATMYSDTDAAGMSAFALFELSGVQNQPPLCIGPKVLFTDSPDSFTWQCNWPVPIEKECRIRIYPENYAATSTLSIHLEGWLDG